MYLQTGNKFRQHISINSRDLTTSGFKNKRLPFLNSTSGFYFSHYNRHVILHQPAKSHPNRSTHGGNMMS